MKKLLKNLILFAVIAFCDFAHQALSKHGVSYHDEGYPKMTLNYDLKPVAKVRKKHRTLPMSGEPEYVHIPVVKSVVNQPVSHKPLPYVESIRDKNSATLDHQSKPWSSQLVGYQNVERSMIDGAGYPSYDTYQPLQDYSDGNVHPTKFLHQARSLDPVSHGGELSQDEQSLSAEQLLSNDSNKDLSGQNYASHEPLEHKSYTMKNYENDVEPVCYNQEPLVMPQGNLSTGPTQPSFMQKIINKIVPLVSAGLGLTRWLFPFKPGAQDITIQSEPKLEPQSELTQDPNPNINVDAYIQHDVQLPDDGKTEVMPTNISPIVGQAPSPTESSGVYKDSPVPTKSLELEVPVEKLVKGADSKPVVEGFWNNWKKKIQSITPLQVAMVATKIAPYALILGLAAHQQHKATATAIPTTKGLSDDVLVDDMIHKFIQNNTGSIALSSSADAATVVQGASSVGSVAWLSACVAKIAASVKSVRYIP